MFHTVLSLTVLISAASVIASEIDYENRPPLLQLYDGLNIQYNILYFDQVNLSHAPSIDQRSIAPFASPLSSFCSLMHPSLYQSKAVSIFHTILVNSYHLSLSLSLETSSLLS